jgi:ADP-heptose:LPS heptosyltransferase
MNHFVQKLQRNFIRGLERSLHRQPLGRDDFRRVHIRRILIVSVHDGLGDLLLATPALRAVRQSFLKAHIAVVARAEHAEALRGNVFVNAVIPFYGNWRRWPLKKIAAFVKLLRRRFDLAIVLNINSHPFAGDLIAVASRARYILGAERPLLAGATWNYFYNLLAPAANNKKHDSERSLEIVRYLGMDTEELAEVMPLSKHEKEWATNFLAEHGGRPDDLIIGCHISANSAAKQWGMKNFLQVARYLAAHHGAKIFVSWDESQEALGRQFLSALPFPAIALAGLPLRRLAAALYLADVLVCNDADVMHLAAAVGTPLVAIYCGSSPERSKPIGPEFMAVKAAGDSAAEVEIVIENVQALLASHPKHIRFGVDDFDISDEVLNDYLDILNTSDE